MRYGLILVGVMAIIAFQLRPDANVAYATGAAADAMCIKANPECPCGQLKNQKTQQCEFKGIAANPYMCPKYCYDITSGKVAAKGECIAPGKCKASECGGKQCEQPKMPEMPKPPPPMPPMPPPPPPPSTPSDCPPKKEDGGSASTTRSNDGAAIDNWGDVGAGITDPNCDKNASSTDDTSGNGVWVTETQSPATVDAFRNVLDDIAQQGVGGCGGTLSVVCPVIRALGAIRNTSATSTSGFGFVGQGIGSGFTVMALFGGSEFGVYDSRYGLLTTQDLTDLQAASVDQCDSACSTRLSQLEERYKTHKTNASKKPAQIQGSKVFIEPGSVTGFAAPPGTYVADSTGFTQGIVGKIWNSVLGFLGLL